jgi:hypothetical protein
VKNTLKSNRNYSQTYSRRKKKKMKKNPKSCLSAMVNETIETIFFLKKINIATINQIIKG